MATRANARQRMVARQRGEEARVNALKSYTTGMATMGAANERDHRVSGRIRTNQAAIRASESMFAQHQKERHDTMRRRARQNAQEEALAEALAQQKNAEEARMREIQLICENDPTLRELQDKIKTAYINKEREDQIAAAEQMAEMEKAQVAAMDAQMEHDRRRGLEEEAAQEYRRRLNQVDARLVIEQQLIEKERAKFFQGEREAQRDKAMVDSIVSKIQSEDAAEAADRAKRKAESQKFIAAFKEEQAGWKRAQAEAEAAEERRIAEYAAAQERREAAVAAQKAEAEAAKDAIYGKLVDEQKERQRQLDEEDMLRMLLAEEENELRLEAAERARREKKEADLRAMKEANEAQTRLKAYRAEQARLEEEEAARRLKAKFIEDARLEAEAARKREEAKKKYMDDVAGQKAERARMFEMQRQAELEASRREAEKEAYRQRVVEEARRKLLQEHAAALRGHLPKGVLKSEKDLELLRG